MPLRDLACRIQVDTLWPQLRDQIDEALATAGEDVTEEREREPEDMLSELLDLTRDIAKRPEVAGQNKQPFITRDYKTLITIVPDAGNAEVKEFISILAKDDKIRQAGIVAWTQGGTEGQIHRIGIQAHRPVSRERIVALAEDAPVEIIDVFYRPLRLRDASE